MAVLETRGLIKEFSGFRAVDDVDFQVQEGSVHAMVGPNGSGKTTLFNLLTGFLKPTAGRISLFGEDVTRLSPDQIARRGAARSFQITSLFEQLTVLEHVQLALQARTTLGYRWWASDRALHRFRHDALGFLDQVGLAELAARPASSLPYGQKRALELALALALDPKILLLDEPTAGMALSDVHQTIELIKRMRAGRTIVLVEHNMRVVSELADAVTVLQYGKIIAQGPYDAVRQDPRVITAYLGEAHV